MRSLRAAILIALHFCFAVWAYRRLPELASPDWSLWLPGAPADGTEALRRGLVAFAPPIASLGLWLLLAALASTVGERAGRRFLPGWLVSERTGTAAIERFSPTFAAMVLAIAACAFFLHVGAVATILEWPVWVLRGSLAAIGLAMMVLGNIVPRTRPNWIAGLRTKSAMRDPDLWRTTHRRFGALLMLTGLAVVVTAMLATPFALPVGVAGALASAIAASVSAGRDGAQASEEPTSASV
jgi:hypothetical protein